jgi:exonuclease SbcD
MRILHTADWHLGRTLEGRSRMAEQESLVDELARLVDEERIDLVLIAGDVYDSVNPPAAAEQLFYEALTRLGADGRRPVAVIAGNHDHPDRVTAALPLASRQSIRMVGLPTAETLSIPVPSAGQTARLYALPYPSEARLNTVLAEQADERLLQQAYSGKIAALIERQRASFGSDTVNLIMSHLYVAGGRESESERPIQVGGAYTVEAAVFSTAAQYAALGHLHRAQTIRAPIPVRYCGSPIAFSFSEAGQAKSVTVVDVNPGEPARWTEIPLSSGRPLVRWHAAGGIAEVERWVAEGRDSSAWIELHLHVSDALSMEDIHRLRRMHGGIIHIRPVFPERQRETRVSDRSGLPIGELFKQFYARQTGGAEPEPELVSLFLDLVKDDDASGDGGDAA